MGVQGAVSRARGLGVRLVVGERAAGGQRVAVRVGGEAGGIEQVELAVTVPDGLSAERLEALRAGLAQVLREAAADGVPWSGLLTTLLEGCAARTPLAPAAVGLGGRVAAAEADRLMTLARRQGFEGEPCRVCGQFTLVRTGSCQTCVNCYAPGSCG